MSAPPRLSVVLPVRNESHRLRRLLPELDAVRPRLHEIIVVDGRSVDGTLDTAIRVLPRTIALTQSRRGRGNALACGFAAATGDVLVTLDVHGPVLTGPLVAALAAGSDLVTSSRYLPAPDRRRRTAAHSLGVTAANVLFGASFTDMTGGSHAFRAALLPALSLPQVAASGPRPAWGDGSEIDVVLLCRAAASGAVVTEVGAGSAAGTVPEASGLLGTVLAEHRYRRRRDDGNGRDDSPGGHPDRPPGVRGVDLR